MLRGLRVVVSGITLAVVTLVGVNVVSAQEAPKPAPRLVLEGDAAMIVLLVKPESAGEFDTVLAKYKEALAKNDNPARKEQLAGMKFFKSAAPVGGNAAYFFYVDPVVKNQEYDITMVLTEVFPSEVAALFEKYKAAFVNRQIFAMNKVQ